MDDRYSEYTRGANRIMAMRQGLQRVEGSRHEIVAPRHAAYADANFDWQLTPNAAEFIENNCASDVRLRYDESANTFKLAFDDATDMTVFKTGF